MSTIQDATELRQKTALARSAYGFLMHFWGAFQERRKRSRVRTALCDLSDWELHDIGIARGEIEHVAMNRSIDPRGARSESLG